MSRVHYACHASRPLFREVSGTRRGGEHMIRIHFDRNRHWSTQFRYISLFAYENSHYLCTGTRARAEKLAAVSVPVCHLRGLCRNWVLIRKGKPRLRSN